MWNKIYQGSAKEILKTFPDESIDCLVTSPPYWNLRAYGTNPQVWDGDSNCEHVWGDEKILVTGRNDGDRNRLSSGSYQGKGDDKFYVGKQTASQGNFCSLCGAWRGELGLEPTFEMYISHLMQIFTEVKRVLKKTGTCWVNLGDSYSGSNCGSNDYRALNGENPKYNHFAEVYKGQKPGKTSVAAKSLCCVPDRFKVAMVDDESMDEYELRNDLTKEEKEYVLTELTKRGII